MIGISHYLTRAKQLGLKESIQQTVQKAAWSISLWGRTFWWGLKSRHEMEDGALLNCTTGKWRTITDLLNHLADRADSSFLFDLEPREQVISLFQSKYPLYISKLISYADAICAGKIHLKDHWVYFPEKVDWNRDPLSGFRWPLLYKDRLASQYIWSQADSADLLLTWELNRHQHFIILGLTFWITKDVKYVKEFITQISGWIKENPVQHGINWYDSMEIAIRLIAWTVAFQLFRDSRLFLDSTGSAFIKMLYQQADYLSTHLQSAQQAIPNNHLISEATALVVVGTIFPEFRAAAAWRENGLQLLNIQTILQTHPDGVNKEQATGYHRFIAELLLIVVTLSRRGAFTKLPKIEDVLEKMLDYILYNRTPASTAPMIGDSDGGRVLGTRINEDFWDFYPILTAGAVLFNRTDWRQMAGQFNEEALWLLGIKNIQLWDDMGKSPSKYLSKAFPEAGQYIIRNSWSEDSDFAFFRCGQFGLGGEWRCSHAHCDLLSVEMWINGAALLVDSGTFSYHGSWRNYFHSTTAHNVMVVDGKEQAETVHEFAWKQIPRAQCIGWEEGKRVTGRFLHNSGETQTRELNYLQKGTWEITDRLENDGLHGLTWFFHFAPGLTQQFDDSGRLLILKETGDPFVLVTPPDHVIKELRTSWYSPTYLKKVERPLLFAAWSGEIPPGGKSFTWNFHHIKSGDLK
jgi:hypothetical protein